MTHRALRTLEAVRWIAWVWQQRARTRAALNTLDARLLDDVGISRGAQRSECAKWFWR